MAAYRYRPGRYYRRRAFSLGGRGGNAGPIAVVAVAVLAAASAGTHATVRHAAQRHSTGVSVAAAPVASGSETAFWRAMLADLGAPASQANLSGLHAWRPREQPWPSLAQWNPLDSILPMPGSWAFNTFDGDLHVQNYPTAAEGADADALTLTGGNYPRIVADLRAGDGLCDPALAGEFLTWSGDGYSGVC